MFLSPDNLDDGHIEQVWVCRYSPLSNTQRKGLKNSHGMMDKHIGCFGM